MLLLSGNLLWNCPGSRLPALEYKHFTLREWDSTDQMFVFLGLYGNAVGNYLIKHIHSGVLNLSNQWGAVQRGKGHHGKPTWSDRGERERERERESVKENVCLSWLRTSSYILASETFHGWWTGSTCTFSGPPEISNPSLTHATGGEAKDSWLQECILVS